MQTDKTVIAITEPADSEDGTGEYKQNALSEESE